MPKWKHFTKDEMLNPYFNGCPHETWEDLPHRVRVNLEYTLELLEDIREHINIPIRITSTYRVQKKQSAHKYGKAIDFQFIGGTDTDYARTMDYLRNECGLGNFRAILEWKGKGNWIHIDRNYRDINKEVFMVAFPVKDLDGEMKIAYRYYGGELPQDIARLA